MCTHMYFCIYIYIYMYVYIYIYIYIYAAGPGSLRTSGAWGPQGIRFKDKNVDRNYMSITSIKNTFMKTCVYMHTYIYICIHVSMCIYHLCIPIYMYITKCTYTDAASLGASGLLRHQIQR